MVPWELVADYFQGLDWWKGIRLKYVAWAGVAKSGAQQSCCCCSSSEDHVLCLMKDWWWKLDSLKLILPFLSISPCKRKIPSHCCGQHRVCLASGRAGMCRKAGDSRQMVNESLCAGDKRTAALFDQTCETFGEIQSLTEIRWWGSINQ